MRTGGLFQPEGVCYVGTRRRGSVLARLDAAAGGFRQAIGCLWRRPAVVRAHAASHAGCARKSLLLWLARCAACLTMFHLHGGAFRQFAAVRSGVLARRRIRHARARRLRIALTEARGLAGLFGAAALPVAPRDARVPAAALARALQDAGVRARPAGRARDTVVQHDSTEAIRGRLAAIHNDLAGAR